jgi:SSS family solute:Na+ symporter
MTFTPIDIVIFIVFYACVLTLSLVKSRGSTDAAGYFLGGRSLPWWLIGISIVAANISTEQFVGMAGQAAGSVGLAVAAWQLTGIVGIVVVAFTFLPRFLKAGIYTMPEYLEHRYSPAARTIMSVLTVLVYVLVTTAAVLYSGATTLATVFGMRLEVGVVIIAALAVLYTTWGGLLAAVWADLIQGTALLVGGIVTLLIGLHAVGGVGAFVAANGDRLHMLLPRTHPELPWTVLTGGIWIPIFYYCGLNQFIVQRALGAGSLRQAQLGIVFAAALWLLVPIGIVMPGIVAHQLYGAHFTRPDEAYPTLVRELVPTGFRGFLFAALAGAVISTLASVLNSASTIFTMDLYRRHYRPAAAEATLVAVGRWTTVLFLAVGCVMALSPLPRGGVFAFIQEFQGYISPGILATFLIGFLLPTAPPAAAVTALVASAPIYGLLQWQWGSVPYLHRMLWTFLVLVAVMVVITWIAPLAEPRRLPESTTMNLEPSRGALAVGVAVIGVVVLFFVAFR